MVNIKKQDVIPETDDSAMPVKKQSDVTTVKNVPYRIFAFLFAVIAIASLFIPYATVLKANGVDDEPVTTSFFNAFLGLFTGKANAKLFGFLPVYTNLLLDHGANSPANISGIGSACVLYAFFILLTLAIVFGIIALFTTKKAPSMLRATVFCFLYAYGMYALWTTTYIFLNLEKFNVDIVSFAGAGLGFIAMFILALKKRGIAAFYSFLQFLLTLAVSCILIISISANTTAYQNGFAVLKINAYELVIFGVILFCALNIFCSFLRIDASKGLVVDCIRYIIQLLLTGFASYLMIANKAESLLFMILTIVAAGISLFQIIFCFIQKKSAKKHAEKATKAELVEDKSTEKNTEEEAVSAIEYVKEEHVEPVSYNGGPIDGVATAELVDGSMVEPTAKTTEEPATDATASTEAKTAGYDFFNTKSFDPFIATLSDQERNDFTDLFVLRCKGDMPEIPAYVVGSPDKDFFRKIFVYLGKYRDMIPDELLMKIYQFSLKLK